MNGIYIYDMKENNEINTKELYRAATELGFFLIKNHSIPIEEIDKMFKISKEFFDLDKHEKDKYKLRTNYGYVPLGTEVLSTQYEMDYKEAFNGPPKITQVDEIFPKQFIGNGQFFEAFSKKCHDVGRNILKALSRGLDLEENYFDKPHSFELANSSLLRILHYPPIPETVNKEKITRAGIHSDYGTLTLLFQEAPKEDQPCSGLQVLNNKDEWIDMPNSKDLITVNIADLFSIWTRGKLRSAKHRVVFNSKQALSSRYSIAYFMHPEYDFPIYPIPSESDDDDIKESKIIAGPSPFTYGETDRIYLQRRLDATYF